jgi:hypothetical protein
MSDWMPHQHVVRERHTEQIRKPAAIFDVTERLQPKGRAKRHACAGVRMTTPAPLAFSAADLEGNDDEIAGHECPNCAPYIHNAAGRLVAKREWAAEARFPSGDHEIQITSRYRKRLDDRVARILNDRRRDIPPLDPVLLDVSQLSHAASSRRRRYPSKRLESGFAGDKRIARFIDENVSSGRNGAT